jgi:hypothetical protein
MIISFTNTGSGLITIDGDELSQFAIAGADKKFVWAKAKIEGDKVIVWNDMFQIPCMCVMPGPIIRIIPIYIIKKDYRRRLLERIVEN